MGIIDWIFWICIFLIFHSYIFFPIILKAITGSKHANKNVYNKGSDELPRVNILMAVYNEEAVIREKLDSVLASDYPLGKIKLLIGSDASTDNTDSIIGEYRNNHPGTVELTIFEGRTGKPEIINRLSKVANDEVFIITDANVMFDKSAIYELVKHFKNNKIGLVDSNMINKNLKKDGISVQEKSYISREVMIKQYESRLNGCMMGPFGGCYAIRKELFSIVPGNFLVDDFYINMRVLEQRKMAINDLNAKVFEDVSNNMQEEFRRKIRISTGNYQNLKRFWKLLFPPFKPTAFCFYSHKVLRWIGPILIIAIYASNLLLINTALLM